MIKKNKNSAIPKSIDLFQFHIIPIFVSSSLSSQDTFFFYAEKGAQVIGKINQPITPSPTPLEFERNQIKRFRVANDKNLTYHWSLYKLTSQDEQEYVESILFNIKAQFQLYIKEFIQVQNDLYRIFHEKDKKTQIQQIWKDLRHDLKTQHQFTALFPKFHIKLMFKIKINCQYDFQYQRWEQQKQRRKYFKKNSIMRKASNQSRNSHFKSPSQNSFNQHKQKIIDSNISSEAPSEAKYSNVDQLFEIKKIQEKQEIQQVKESQIKITSPEGADLTMQIPEKFLNHRKAMEDEFYYIKKTSMLSDIIQQSYEGSSNANLMRSNQGERLKSVDIILEQEEPMFSPMIKTQTFESEKHEAYFNQIKRTATLAHKHSQQFELQETPKAGNKRTGQSGNKSGSGGQRYDDSNQKNRISESGKMNTSGRGFHQIEEQEKQVTVDYSEAKRQIIKNAMKVLLIVILLVVAVNIFSIFERSQPKSYSQSRTHKSSKDLLKRQEKPQKPIKPKLSKSKS